MSNDMFLFDVEAQLQDYAPPSDAQFVLEWNAFQIRSLNRVFSKKTTIGIKELPNAILLVENIISQLQDMKANPQEIRPTCRRFPDGSAWIPKLKCVCTAKDKQS